MSTAPATINTSLGRYDRVTIGFHWLTAALVVLLFGSSWLWDHVPRDLQWRRPLEDVHVSFGIAFAAVILGRIVWRWVRGRKLPADAGLQGLLSKLVHFALYGLLILQVGLGFGLRWMQGEDFSFFGLFSIPQLFAPDRPLAHTLQELHSLTGWAIVILAAGHAVAALYHHYVARDGVLKRMIPAREAA
ncbi:MAG: cytochrome b [Devosia sp.]|nr:cytochrome b [Devosia sp.]